MVYHSIRDQPHAPRGRSARLLIALLVVLFLGPLLAPLFQATSLSLVADSGALARDMLARYVCPTPAKSYTLLGFPMAVCARCWGATIGLWVAWLLFRMRGARLAAAPIVGRSRFLGVYLALPRLGRLGLAIGALLLWRLEIAAWPSAALLVLLINGISGGFWCGLWVGADWRWVRQRFQRMRAGRLFA